MIDFLLIATRDGKRGVKEVYPKFIVRKSDDLMIRGQDFYAIWLEDRGLWSTDEQDALDLIDNELDIFAKDYRQKNPEVAVRVLHMWDAENRMIDSWHRYCKKDMRDSFHMLDEKLIFSNDPTNKKDYASKRLSYPLEPCPIEGYETLMSKLYSPEERHKIEWAIGSIVDGASKKIQKFLVLYGAAGTGKSTVLNIIEQLFDGYCATFEARALGSASAQFALEPFKTNPLVAVQHDGDLSKIEDNTRLNSLVSHEMMTVNEKFKSVYTNRFKCFLFMGTNKPVRITDAKSGLIRRLIDVSPTGDKLKPREYKAATKKIEFELGGIASHCLDIYREDPGAYDDYIPISMLGASNDFYNFVLDSYFQFKETDEVTLQQATKMYNEYCEAANVPFKMSQRLIREELKNYFDNYEDRHYLENGMRVRSYYSGFRLDQFEGYNKEEPGIDTTDPSSWIVFKHQASIFDQIAADCPAQYATEEGTPSRKWMNVKTMLKDILTSRLHYVKVPENHIVIDFDIPDEQGNKSLAKNIEAANGWPKTYAELSKSGQGIHLHYIYTGDPKELDPIYDEHVEVKVYTGGSSLRRKLTRCNDIPIAEISSGLPFRKESKKKVIDFKAVTQHEKLVDILTKAINKQYEGCPSTSQAINLIEKVLDDAYRSGEPYDVSEMYNQVLTFAANSTHQSTRCLAVVAKMHFKSDDISPGVTNEEKPIVFYDVEVFPNLLLVNWHRDGDKGPCIRMINPRPVDIETLLEFNLIGFNCRRYDNHIIYAALLGWSNEAIYDLSSRIINGDRNAFFGDAYNISYTDIYDFSSKKQSLKQWEIDLGIHHQELGLPWDQPVPPEKWHVVAEYCDNDVLSTEALFHSKKIQADFTARKILAEVAGLTVNDTTNTLTTRIIFGTNRSPQSQFNYRDMGFVDPYKTYTIPELHSEMILLNHRDDKGYTYLDGNLPIFPGYKFEKGTSTYRDEVVGEGGYVYSEPGMYGNVALLDIASMHPSSIRAEKLFGDEYTQRFVDILETRIAIKHKDFDRAKTMLGGALAKYLDDPNVAKDLAQALKIAINSVYGLTSASFSNPFRDPRNVDNIVAKRGALFMINLKHEVQRRGFKVAHIKTDSIKIPDATPEIIQFIVDYGKLYGYNFEHEATYDRMCLVNDAVYIAKYATVDHCIELYGEEYVNKDHDTLADCKDDGGQWTATGTQFQVPYVFKTLFSKEDILFEDMCESKSVKSAIYLDFNERLPEGEHNYQFVGRVGQFTPMISGIGAGVLCRTLTNKDGTTKYTSITGAKGYLWMESEQVKLLQLEDKVDRTYYDRLVSEAIESISTYGDFNWFVSNEPYIRKDDPPWYEDDDPYPADLFNKR